MRRIFAYLSCLMCASLFMCVSVADREIEELSQRVIEKYNEKEVGSGACYVGTWITPAACSGNGREVLIFRSDGSGELSLPDCTGICQDQRYPFNYTINGNLITLNYTKPQSIYCDGYGQQPLDTPATDMLSMKCADDKLTTTDNGSKTYTRL